MHFGSTYASLSNQNISFITEPNCKNIRIQAALFIHSVTFNSFCTICSELFSIKRSAFEFATAVKNLSLNFTYKPIYFACIDNNQYKITSNGGALNLNIELKYKIRIGFVLHIRIASKLLIVVIRSMIIKF